MKPKSSKINTKTTALPLPPWIFISNFSDLIHDIEVVDSLKALIPAAMSCMLPATSPVVVKLITGSHFRGSVCILGAQNQDRNIQTDLKLANEFRDASIVHGVNFVSIHLFDTTEPPTLAWGTNHLNLHVKSSDANHAAETIYKWLFKTLTITETLHLIPDSELQHCDSVHMPDFTYSTLHGTKDLPKDAKVKFIAIITSKPQIKPGDQKRLTWTVADKTGSAQFFFTHRGPSSQYTWDWVLKLQPGDRAALPRMPSVLVSEPRRKRVLKAPFRAVGAVVHLAGVGVESLGSGVKGVARGLKMGEAKEWVAEADVVYDRKGKAMMGKKTKKDTVVKAKKMKSDGLEQKKLQCGGSLKVFSDEGKMLWRDDDSVASTERGDEECDEKVVI